MKVRVKVHKLLRIKGLMEDSEIELPEGCTVDEFFGILGIDAHYRGRIVTVVNGEPVWNATRLKENDVINLLVSISGG
jgi:sulfur carrier protein ThiS